MVGRWRSGQGREKNQTRTQEQADFQRGQESSGDGVDPVPELSRSGTREPEHFHLPARQSLFKVDFLNLDTCHLGDGSLFCIAVVWSLHRTVFSSFPGFWILESQTPLSGDNQKCL